MFHAAFQAPNGRISAFYILDLMQSDVLFFSADNIVFEPPFHRVTGICFDSDAVIAHPLVTQDITAFTQAVRQWTTFSEENAGICVAADQIGPEAHALFAGEPLTAVSLMNLLCQNVLKISMQDSIYIVAADARVKGAVSSLGSLIRRLIRAAMTYDGIQAEQINVVFTSCDGNDAQAIRIRRLIVAAAAPLDIAFDAQLLKARAPILDGISTEIVQSHLGALARRGVLTQEGAQQYRVNYHSRDAAILFAEYEAAQSAAQNRDTLRNYACQQAQARYERVRTAARNCQATIHDQESQLHQLEAQIDTLTPQLSRMQKKDRRANSAGGTTITALLFIFCIFCACLFAYLIFWSNVPETFGSISSHHLGCAFGSCAAALFLAALIRIFSAWHIVRRCTQLRNELEQVQQQRTQIAQALQTAQRESGIYAAYLVLTRVIAQDMQNGDFRGLDLAERLVPAELCAFAREHAAAVRTQIIIALSHCGTCTQNELAFLSGAGHERVRRALFDMIAAGQIVLWRENGRETYCLRQSLQQAQQPSA